jgi:dTMP kinase
MNHLETAPGNDPERLLNCSCKYEYEWQINPYSGLFIVIEGLDGSGNSTQVDMLRHGYFADWFLDDRRIKIEKEPTYGPFGAPVNYSLRRNLKVDDVSLQLGFSADRSDHLNTAVIGHLKQQGNIVLMDRYFASTIAYGYAAEIDIDWLMAVQSKFIVPDLMCFLDVSPKICLERILDRNEKTGRTLDRYEKLGLLQKAREGYLAFSRKAPGVMTIIDGDRSRREVNDEIIRKIGSIPKVRQ